MFSSGSPRGRQPASDAEGSPSASGRRPRPMLAKMFFKASDDRPQEASVSRRSKSVDFIKSVIPNFKRSIDKLFTKKAEEVPEVLKPFATSKIVHGPWPSVLLKFKTECEEKALELGQRLRDAKTDVETLQTMHPRNSSLKVLGEIIQDADTKMEILQDIGIPFDSERMSLLVGVCDNISILVSSFSNFWGENHAFYWALVNS
ncbi:hypothetical protein BC829DRAFT_135157, partial [Chytridium lagenaria]